MIKDTKLPLTSLLLLSVILILAGSCGNNTQDKKQLFKEIRDKNVKAINDSVILGALIYPNECVNCYLVFQVLQDELEQMQRDNNFNAVFLMPEMREIEREPFVNKELDMKNFEGGRFIYSDQLFEEVNQKVEEGIFQLNYRNASGLFLLDHNSELIYFQDFKRFDLDEVKTKLEQL